MSNVIPMPGAMAAPVVQPQRRGRYPRGVMRLQSFRIARRYALAQATALFAKAQERRRAADYCLECMHLALGDAALLEQQAAVALRAISRKGV